MAAFCAATLALALPGGALALDNGLGLLPPLGYNAYDHVGCCANESTMKAQGQALLDSGLHALGFTYVNMDCGWMGGRHPNGTIYESPTKFPAGMRALADWLHAKGLKLGVYSDRGTHDFSGNFGMKGHETGDANWMASVGVDYLKVDDMSGTPKTQAGAAADYGKIRDALNATGRPIFFSTCGHSPAGDKHEWAGPACGDLANACRISADIRYWGNGTFGTAKAVNVMASYNGSYSHAGSWPDPDLVFSAKPVGGDNEPTCKGAGKLAYCTGSFCDPGPNNAEAQLALWSILGAPLLYSFDMQNLMTDPAMKKIYTNPEVIAVNQDADASGRGSMGGRRVHGSDLPEAAEAGGLTVWVRSRTARSRCCSSTRATRSARRA